MESHRERKRSRPSPEVTVEELLLKWTQCHYFLPKKMRLCNLGRTPGSNYCGNHRPTGEDVTERVKRQASSGDTSRIPCPVDPSHTIYKYNVDAHIKVCNVSKHLHELEKEAYYCLGCNSGSNEIQASEMREVIDSDKLAAKIRSCYHSYVLGTLHEPVEDDNDIASIEELCISQLAKGQSSFQQLRHVKQDALIIRQMQAAHLFDKDVSKVYLELGAGKGKLGVSINAVSPLSRVVFIERSGQRRKADREGGDGNFVRIRMDIRDVIISKLPEVVFPTNKDNETRACDDTIIVAKHLCGAATDLALRSINSFRLGPSGQIAGQFKGVAVATCCHHACNWIDYTGAEWLTLRGFSGAEFEIMKYWSGWAHSFTTSAAVANQHIDVDDEGGVEEHEVVTEKNTQRPTQCGPDQLKEIGWMTKRVIDHGRAEYLRSLGLTATLVRYCPPKLSPECFLLLATRCTSDDGITNSNCI